MKSVRIITVISIVIIFLAALGIGLGVIFAVRNINVTIESYTYGSGSDTASGTISGFKDVFNEKYKGKLINTVSEEDIAADLAEWNCDYTLDSFEKKLPCTINITLLERRETYSYYSEADSLYYIYDMDGQLMRTAETEEEAMNGGDSETKANTPNVTLHIPDISYVEEAAALGKAFQSSFSASFEDGAPIRSTVEYIYIVEKTGTLAGNNVIFQLRSGIQVEIYDYEEDLENKMSAAYDEFKGLDAESKLTGYIYCFYDNSGILKAAYQPSGKATS